MKKKILIFSIAYTPYEGGAEIAIREIASRNKDFDFDMITLRYDKNLPKKEKIGNIVVHRIGFVKDKPSMMDLVRFPMILNKYFFPVTAFFKAQKLNKKNKYNATWAMMAAYAGFAAMLFKMFNKKIPYLLSLQEGDPIDEIKKKVRFVKPFFKKIFTSADFIQVISKYLLEYARMMGYKGEVRVIPNAVNLKVFNKNINEEKKNELKKKLAKKEGDKFLITTSRLVKKNGIADIIRSLKYLEKNIKLLVIGDGPDEHKLKELVKEKKLADRVFWLGKMKQHELPKYLAVSDVFVRPSLSEGLGNSFLEAMACGVPVVATPVGGILDFLFDPKDSKKPTGLFCEVKNPRSIAEAVKRITTNKRLSEEIVTNSHELIYEKFDWDKIGLAMSKVFKKVTA